MSGSIFSGLCLAGAGGALEIRYPRRIHDAPRVAHGVKLAGGDAECWVVRGASGALKTFFCELNGFPPPYAVELRLEAAKEPLVSCVVVVNENVPFVREQLLPPLIAHSQAHAVEIILVYNGSAREDPALGAFRSLRSAWSAVAAAYNAGARAARGQYLALFHDDCVIDDPLWIDKCVAALEGGAGAVAAEYRRMESVAGVAVPPLPVAKCVPLVMRREAFLASGGYDEFHYVGYEDLDLTLALSERGMKLAAVDLKMRHFSGMSSTLKYCPVPGLATLYAMTALPARAIRRRFREFTDQGVRLEGVDLLRIGLDVQLLYVLKKYRAFLGTIDARAYGDATAALERRLTSACPFDANLVLPRFKEIDRLRASS